MSVTMWGSSLSHPPIASWSRILQLHPQIASPVRAFGFLLQTLRMLWTNCVRRANVQEFAAKPTKDGHRLVCLCATSESQWELCVWLNNWFEPIEGKSNLSSHSPSSIVCVRIFTLYFRFCSAKLSSSLSLFQRLPKAKNVFFFFFSLVDKI